jgi:hypothetical protein
MGKGPTQPALGGSPGNWLSYTVMLTNRSAHAFRFGRSCPAYVEGFAGRRETAYVLNCHAIGTVAPHASVRLAMRIRVPSHLKLGDTTTLGWTLAPHSWNAPVDQILLHLR